MKLTIKNASKEDLHKWWFKGAGYYVFDDNYLIDGPVDWWRAQAIRWWLTIGLPARTQQLKERRYKAQQDERAKWEAGLEVARQRQQQAEERERAEQQRDLERDVEIEQGNDRRFREAEQNLMEDADRTSKLNQNSVYLRSALPRKRRNDGHEK